MRRDFLLNRSRDIGKNSWEGASDLEKRREQTNGVSQLPRANHILNCKYEIK